MDNAHLLAILDNEGAAISRAMRHQPALTPFFTLDFTGKSVAELRDAYLRLLKMTADYVRHSVPMLRAAANVLRHGDDEDRAWSELFLAYAEDETDEKDKAGHHVWALSDMRALGAPPSLLEAPPHPIMDTYTRHLIEEAELHPYAVLGTKGALEHFSIHACDDLVKGVLASGIENAKDGVSVFHHHGILDIEHVRAGDKNLERIKSPQKRQQIVEGAYFTSGSYRAFLRFYV